MRFRKRKERTCDTARYALEKTLKIRQNCIILITNGHLLFVMGALIL